MFTHHQFHSLFADVPSEKSIKKWGHTSTPDYLERRHRYRRSEIKERSKTKASAAAAAAKELEKASSKDSFDPCCADGRDCNCAIVKKELKEGMAKTKGDNESLDGEQQQQQQDPVTPINKYTTNAMPKRIMNLKKTRSKTVPSSVFYATLGEMAHDLNASVQGEGDQSSVTGSQEQLIAKKDHHQPEEDHEEEDSLTGSRISTSSEASPGRDRSTRKTSKSSAFRASDSHLNYNKIMAAKRSNSEVAALIRSNTISSSSCKVEKTSSGSAKVKKNNSSLYKSWRSVKEEESYLSFQHLPGSSNLGERIANVDYADPQRLFCVKSATQRMRSQVEKTSVSGSVGGQQQQQRDSVVSFTSSSDSVEETTRSKVVRPESLIFDRIGDDSYYEEDIERCLEDASLFRDSAIYSDDNDPRRPTATAKSTRRSSSSNCSGQEQQPPPPVPYKPKHVTQLQQRKLQELAHKKLERQLSGGKGKVPLSPSPSSSATGEGAAAAAAQQHSFLYKGNN